MPQWSGQSRYGITTNTQRNDNVVRQRNNNPCRQSHSKRKPTYTRIDSSAAINAMHRFAQGLPPRSDRRTQYASRRILIGGFVNHLQNLAAQHLPPVSPSAGGIRTMMSWLLPNFAASALQNRLFAMHHALRQFSRFFERNFDNRTTGEIQPPLKPRTPIITIAAINSRPEMPKPSSPSA